MEKIRGLKGLNHYISTYYSERIAYAIKLFLQGNGCENDPCMSIFFVLKSKTI